MANINPNYGTQANTADPIATSASVTPNTQNLPNTYDELATKQPSTVDFIKNTEESLGIPQQQKAASSLRDQLYSLEDSLKRVAPNVAATTKNSFVTQAQRENMIGAAQKPIIENYNITATNLGRVTEGITALQDREARLTSAFTADKQTALTLAIEKLQRGEKLTDDETARAYDAVESEKAYNRAVEMAKLQQQLDVKTAKETYRAPASSNVQNDIANAFAQLGIGNAKGGALNQTISPPNFNKPVDTIEEFPKGSGDLWVSLGTEGWRPA